MPFCLHAFQPRVYARGQGLPCAARPTLDPSEAGARNPGARRSQTQKSPMRTSGFLIIYLYSMCSAWRSRLKPTEANYKPAMAVSITGASTGFSTAGFGAGGGVNVGTFLPAATIFSFCNSAITREP